VLRNSTCVRHRRAAHVAVLLFLVLSILGLVEPVTAFTVVDHAMCKDFDESTMTCRQKTTQFDLADKWAYFWSRITFEASDIGTSLEFKFYDPQNRFFVGSPTVPGFKVAAAKESVVWMAIGVAGAGAKGSVGGVSWTGGAWSSLESSKQPTSQWPGEWRAELLLGGRVAVSERFIIGKAATTGSTTTASTAETTTVTTSASTRTSGTSGAFGLPTDMMLIAGIAGVVVVIVAGLLYIRRRRAPIPQVARTSSARLLGSACLGYLCNFKLFH